MVILKTGSFADVMGLLKENYHILSRDMWDLGNPVNVPVINLP